MQGCAPPTTAEEPDHQLTLWLSFLPDIPTGCSTGRPGCRGGGSTQGTARMVGQGRGRAEGGPHRGWGHSHRRVTRRSTATLPGVTRLRLFGDR